MYVHGSTLEMVKPMFTAVCYEHSFTQEMFTPRFFQLSPYPGYFRNVYSKVYKRVHGVTPVMFTRRITSVCTYSVLIKKVLIQCFLQGVPIRVYSSNVYFSVFIHGLLQKCLLQGFLHGVHILIYTSHF